MYSLITNFSWKNPASYCVFPPCSVSGFTLLTSLVAAQKDEIFSNYDLFIGFYFIKEKKKITG